MSRGAIDISKLSPDERLHLLEEIWDSLVDDPNAVPLTDAQREELDRRLDDLEAESPVGIPWQDVLDRIRNRGM
jgi:putative addiction module component (TIGR02574 family)